MRPAELTLDLLRRGLPATMRVRGRSMWPWMDSGDLLRIEPAEALVPGQVVLFDDGREQLVAHRLMVVEPDRVRCRGDHCEEADPWTPCEAVVGVVVAVERSPWRRLVASGPSRRLLGTLRRARRRSRSWSWGGKALYALVRGPLRPWSLSMRCIQAIPAPAVAPELPDGLRVVEGTVDALVGELAGSPMSRPQGRLESSRGLLVYDGEGPVASIWWCSLPGEPLVLQDTYVVPSARGRGLGRWLIAYGASRAEPGTEVLMSTQLYNSASLAKNRAVGARVVGWEFAARLWPLSAVWRWVLPGGERPLVEAWRRNVEARRASSLELFAKP